MAGPWGYAQAIVVARAIKSRLLKGEEIREMALSKDLSEALLVLRESLYRGVGEARSLTHVFSSVWGSYFRIVRHMAKVAPGEALDAVLAMEREEDLRDLLIIIQRIASNRPVEEMLPSSFYDGTLTYQVLRDPELLTSPHKVAEALHTTWAAPYLESSLSILREVKEGLPIVWAIPLITTRLCSNAIENLRGAKKSGLERLLCPHLEAKILSSLVMAKELGVQTRILEIAWGNIRVCKVSLKSVREIYEREAEIVGLAEELKGILRNVKFEGKTLKDITTTSQRNSRLIMRARALEAMSGYPYNPAFLVASLVLLKLEVNNVLLTLSSKEFKLKPDEILEELTLEA
ncbi:MAG: V-type ATPase subunit [Thermoprotei archaeon]|nr:V-type ATPase subunit [Thermoprotei archaeon]